MQRCRVWAVTLESRHTAVRNRIDAAYVDQLDGKITEGFWEWKASDWRAGEQQLLIAIDGVSSVDTASRALSAEETFELSNKPYSLYLSQNSTEKAKLLRMLIPNSSVGR